MGRALLLLLVVVGCSSQTPAPAPTPERTDSRCDPARGDRPGERYTICGCGCCGSADADDVRWVFSTAELEQIKRDDAEAAKDPMCAVAGCSLGTVVQLCLRQ